MKARYIGGESEPGSRSTKLFGITVYCDQVFDVPTGFEKKARLNPYVEVIEDVADVAATDAVEPEAPKRTRKTKPKADADGA